MMSKPTIALFGVLTLVAILAIAPSAFAESGTTVNISAGAGSSPNCSQANNCFNQDAITVAPGTTVTWQNNDKVSHTVTSGSPSDNQTGTIFDSSLIASGKDFSFTFNNPGTYNYFCQVHPWMTGQVIVGAAATTSSTTSSNTPANTTSTTPSMNMSSGTTMSSMPSTSNQSSSTTPTTTTQSAPVQPSETSQVVYNDSDNPSGPFQSMGWVAGMIIAGVLSGLGIWTAVRRR
ncbi:MAG: plastocyanin/azurin family copper-binding protein [Nitrosotalea sp.]